MSEFTLNAVILQNNLSKTNAIVDHHTKMGLFLITADSVKQLEEKLIMFKYSPWWNVMGEFFIFGKINKSCKNTPEMLRTAWKMNVLTSFLFCHDNSTPEPTIFTYNPYTNRATNLWNEVKSNVQQNDRWTLYSRQFHEGNNA